MKMGLYTNNTLRYVNVNNLHHTLESQGKIWPLKFTERSDDRK